MTSAERMRRYRARKKRDVTVVSVEVDTAFKLALVVNGWLDPQQLHDRAAVEEAVTNLHRQLVPATPVNRAIERYA